MVFIVCLICLPVLAWLVQPATSDRSSTRGRWTTGHWYLAGIGSVLLAFAWEASPRDWRMQWSPERETRFTRSTVLGNRWRAVSQAREAVLAEIAVRNAITRATAQNQRFVLVDSGVAQAAAAFIDSLVRAEVRRLAIVDTAMRVFITRPTSDSAGGSALRARRPFDVSWLLPDSTRATCLTVVRLNRDDVSNLLIATGTSLLGPCAFVARFGRPGPHVERWLRATEYAFAAYAAWSNTGLWTTRTDETPYPKRSLTAAQAQCVMGHGVRCRSLLAIDSMPTATPESHFTPVTFRDFSMGGPRLGRYERLFLSDMARDLGPDQFGAFWRSQQPVAAAYTSATGRALEADASAWLRRFYDGSPGGPTVPAATLGAFAAALLVAGLTTIRRRPE